VHQYSFNDVIPEHLLVHELVYYRLRQVDIDGTYSYSVIRDVRFGHLQAELALFPNPFGESFTLQYRSALSGQVEIELLDILGRTRFATKAVVSASGWLEQTLSGLEALPPGTYIVSITHHGVSTQRKLVKQ
jgi:hypothetical protein